MYTKLIRWLTIEMGGTGHPLEIKEVKGAMNISLLTSLVSGIILYFTY